jgi:RHS repeat-associated protein
MKRIISAVIITLFLAVASHAGVDKSGVKPSVLSLPSGPGSVEGLGESFEPQLNSGTATYAVPLNLPAVRGISPQLALEYNSGFGNGYLGMGWRLNIPFIQRQTDKGLPLYQENDTYIESNGEELLLTDPAGIYRCENETSFAKYQKMQDRSWKAYHKDGTVSVFGGTDNARQNRAAGETFRWMISSEQDSNGNQTAYEYFQDKGQIYIKQIRYGKHAAASSSEYRLEFAYSTSRPDPVTDYRGRFKCLTSQRLISITLYDGTRRIRHWALGYADSRHSLLTEVKVFGDDSATLGAGAQINKDFLPPMKLGYTSEISNPTLMNAQDAPFVSFQNGEAELVDINGDSLPDILLNEYDGTYYSAINKGEGNKWESLQSFNFSPTAKLSDAATQIADLSGNGKSKLLIQDYTGAYYYHPFNGAQTFGNDVEFIIPGYFPIDDPNVRFADINNDKAIDLMATDPGALSFLVNKGEGTQNYFLENPPEPPEDGISFANGWQLADMNGDRLMDLVLLGTQEQGGTVFHANKGWGEFDAREVMSGGPKTDELGNLGTDRLFISDINHDGLSDLVFVDSGIVRYWLNENNNKWGATQEITSGIPDYDAVNVAVRFADMNGNGSTDIVWNSASIGLKYLDFFPSEKPFQLSRIENGIGRVIEIKYTTSTSYMVSAMGTEDEWTSVIPFPVDVVSEFIVYDGSGNSYHTEITYRNGYYDGEKKEFRGFEFAEKREIGDAGIPDLIMAHVFDIGETDEALKGKPLAVEAQNKAGEVFYRENYLWDVRSLGQGMNGDDREVSFPYQKTKTRDIVEKGSGTPVQLKWEYEYDDYGNMTKQTESGRLDAAWDDERITVASFSAAYESGVSSWILDKPVEISVTDENGTLAAKKRNYYDGFSVLGEVSKGNLTKTEDWISGADYVVSVRNDYDEYGNVVATYDPLYGTDAGHYRELVYDPVYHTFPVQEIIYTGKSDLPSLSMSATYNYGFGVMTSSTDFNGFTTDYDYDAFGRLTSMTKAPDTSHTLEYDYVLAHNLGNGRIINWVETRQKDSSADGFLKSRTFHDGLGRKVMTRSEGENPGQIVVTDTLKFNARQQPWKKYLPYFESGTLDFTDPKFNTGFTEHFYDALGREIRVNQPADSDGTIVYSATTYQPLIKFVQDEEQTNSGSPHYGCGMRYVEDGLQDKDGNGRLRRVYEVVKLTDAGESGELTEWLTAYAYDLNDNLTRITDAFGNQKFMAYDGLKRKTFMNDPDRGKMYYEYDDAGNLAQTADAKGQLIEYEYDGVNRLIAEYYGGEKASPDVRYYYDTPFGPIDRGDFWESNLTEKDIADGILGRRELSSDADLNRDGKIDAADVIWASHSAPSGNQESLTAENTKGFLSYVQDQSGEEHNSYDERGRVAWVIKRIREGENLQNFCTAMDYDSMDRVTKLTYPDQSSISYAYNSRGLLESVPNVIEQYDYNPSGQNAVLKLACGTETGYSYDHRLRLEHLYTARNSDNLTLQDLTYGFDGVSNIIRIQDNRSDSVLDSIGTDIGIASADARKFNATQSFDYDSLYRLTRAENASVYGTITYRYDRIGNMIHKAASLKAADALMDLGVMSCGGSMGTRNRIGRNAGDAPGPHAVTGTEKGVSGAMQFEYDANGNMISDNGMSLSWDFRDRLAGLKKGTATAAYVYDYSDTRKKKTVTDSEGSSNEVLYVDKYSEVRAGRLVKYVYAGNSRVARAENDGMTITGFYLHDHLGSTAFTLSDNGTVTEQLVNYPYGNLRLEKKAEYASAGADYKFTGKERDLESGLQYFEARYYSGTLGRFNRVDPLAEEIKKEFLIYPQKLNLYVYGNNNPIIFIDPDGKFAFLDNTIKTFQRMGTELSKRTPQGILNAGRLALGYPFSILSGDIFDKPSSINSQVNTFSMPGVRDQDGKLDLLTAQGENQLKNKSHFFGIGDLIQIVGEELGGITINSIHAAEAIEKTGGGNVFAHSQGTSVMRGAFALLDPKIKCNINYVGWGGQSHISIPWHGLNSAINIRNPGDLVPRLAPRNWFSRLFGGWEQGPGHGHSSSQYQQ